jgi:hypothetical protein
MNAHFASIADLECPYGRAVGSHRGLTQPAWQSRNIRRDASGSTMYDARTEDRVQLNSYVVKCFQAGLYEEAILSLSERMRHTRCDPFQSTSNVNPSCGRSRPEGKAAHVRASKTPASPGAISRKCGRHMPPLLISVPTRLSQIQPPPSQMVPPNAFQLYPCLLLLDSETSDSSGGLFVGSKDDLRLLMGGKRERRSFHQSLPGCDEVSSLLEESIRSYNMAMAYLCLYSKGLSHCECSQKSMRPSSSAIRVPFMKQNQILLMALKMFHRVNELLDDLVDELESVDDHHCGHGIVSYMHAAAALNKIRLATLNNAAFLYSMWGRQKTVDECLQLMATCLDERAELVERSRLLLNQKPSSQQYLPQELRRTLLILWKDNVDSTITAELTTDDQGIVEEDIEDESTSIFELNVHFLHPEGRDPIAGASAA